MPVAQARHPQRLSASNGISVHVRGIVETSVILAARARALMALPRPQPSQPATAGTITHGEYTRFLERPASGRTALWGVRNQDRITAFRPVG